LKAEKITEHSGVYFEKPSSGWVVPCTAAHSDTRTTRFAAAASTRPRRAARSEGRKGGEGEDGWRDGGSQEQVDRGVERRPGEPRVQLPLDAPQPRRRRPLRPRRPHPRLQGHRPRIRTHVPFPSHESFSFAVRVAHLDSDRALAADKTHSLRWND